MTLNNQNVEFGQGPNLPYLKKKKRSTKKDLVPGCESRHQEIWPYPGDGEETGPDTRKTVEDALCP